MEFILLLFLAAFVYFILDKFWKRNQNQITDSYSIQKNQVSESKLSSHARELRQHLNLKNNAVISVALVKCKFNEGDITCLKIFSEISTVILLINAVSDQAEEEYKEKIATIIPFVPIHRVLFYENKIGKMAIIRQLKSECHIDDDISVCTQLAPFVRNLFCINSANESLSKSHSSVSVTMINALEEFL
mmetsp:Transcript_26911/g.27139  ORF Transcript_26911/g.27139 Transcript_26911/m.27139 type:complete len:189 (+) Transcript_26911:87-653(+)